MIFILVVILGCFLGYFIAKFTKGELKSGVIYFVLLELFIFLFLSLIFVYLSFNLFLFLSGILLGLIFRFEYFYFGTGLASIINKDFSFLVSSIVFVYGLPYGSLSYYNKNFKILIYSFVFFILPFIIYFLDYNFLSFASGGLLVLSIKKAIEFYKDYF